jgi:hypothetical protein
VRCVLGTLGRLVLELRDSLLNGIGHGLVEGAESMTEVTVAGPFDGDCVEGLEGGCEMLGELAAGVLESEESEVINNQSEEDGTGRKRTGVCLLERSRILRGSLLGGSFDTVETTSS